MNDSGISESDIQSLLSSGDRLMHGGYQGEICIGRIADKNVLIKSAAGAGIRGWLNRKMIHREYRMYSRLDGVQGVPICYGFFMGRYLVLEHIKSHSYRHATISDRDSFFSEFFDVIGTLHDRGVAHGDLQRKDNILVTKDSRPCLVDFGVSVFRKPGFHPLNHFRHSFSHQHDLNAWIKHKYARKYQDISPEDAKYYRPLRIERLARLIKRTWVRLKKSIKTAHIPD